MVQGSKFCMYLCLWNWDFYDPLNNVALAHKHKCVIPHTSMLPYSPTHIDAHIVLVQAAPMHEHGLEEVAAVTVLHDQVDVVLVSKAAVQLRDIWPVHLHHGAHRQDTEQCMIQ